MVAHDIGPVFRETGGPPFRDNDRHGKAAAHEKRQKLDFFRLQRPRGKEAFEEGAGARGPVVGCEMIGDADGEIVDQRRMHHVAEIDDTDDMRGLRRIEQDIVRIEVVMDDLAAFERGDGRQ